MFFTIIALLRTLFCSLRAPTHRQDLSYRILPADALPPEEQELKAMVDRQRSASGISVHLHVLLQWQARSGNTGGQGTTMR